MAFSYSFHLSAKSHAVTNAAKLSQVSKHNLRGYQSDKYNRNMVEVLAGSDNISDDVKQIYHQEFDAALDKYNSGKRPDRQISDYFDHVCKHSRTNVAAEIIIQIGDQDFWQRKSLADRIRMTPLFKDQLLQLQRNCPDFKIASAVVHYDEKSPHMHIVGVPVARGFKQGLSVRCDKTRVFTQESLQMLQDKMRDAAENELKSIPELFSGMQLKEKEPGRNKDIPKKSLEEYYTLQKKSAELGEELERRTSLAAAIEAGDIGKRLPFGGRILSQDQEIAYREVAGMAQEAEKRSQEAAEAAKKAQAALLQAEQQKRHTGALQRFLDHKEQELQEKERTVNQRIQALQRRERQINAEIYEAAQKQALEIVQDWTCAAMQHDARSEASMILSEQGQDALRRVAAVERAERDLNDLRTIFKKAPRQALQSFKENLQQAAYHYPNALEALQALDSFLDRSRSKARER